MLDKFKISKLNQVLAGTASIYAIGLGLSFIFNWAITKILNQTEVGYYQYFISIVTFGIVILPLGFQSLAQREVGYFNAPTLRKFNLLSHKVILFSSTLFVCIWGVGVLYFEWVKGLSDFTNLYFCFLLIPIYTLLTYYRAVLQGQNKIYWSVIPEVLLRPFILLIFCFAFYISGYQAKSSDFILILLGTMVVLLIPSVVKSKANLPTATPERSTHWITQAIALLPITLLYNINDRIDVVMISKNLGPNENAIYSIASKFSAFSAFGLVIINAVLVPLIASHFKSGKPKEELQKIIKPNTRKAFIVSLTISIVLIAFGEQILSLFGKDTENYSAGTSTLMVLILGQLVNVATGSVGYILTMAKLEKLAITSIISSILLNILLNYLLMPVYGILGAAIATTVSMIVWNVLMLIFVKRKTGINPTIF